MLDKRIYYGNWTGLEAVRESKERWYTKMNKALVPLFQDWDGKLTASAHVRPMLTDSRHKKEIPCRCQKSVQLLGKPIARRAINLLEKRLPPYLADSY